MEEGQNKTYFISLSSMEELGGVYVAAQNSRDALKIGRQNEELLKHSKNYTDIKSMMCRDREGKPILSQYEEGELSIFHIMTLGLNWWKCEHCYSDEVTPVIANIPKYTGIKKNLNYCCKYCGRISKIPF